MANTKRATPKRATGGKAAAKTKSPSAKASAAKGKGKASASNTSAIATMANTKGSSRKRKRSSSVTSDDEEECDADDEDNQNNQDSRDSQDKQDSPDNQGDEDREDVEDNDCQVLVRFGTFGEEFFGFEHEYDDEDKSHIPPNSEQRRRNGRQAGRDLIIWNRPYMDAKLLLILQYECARHNIDVPWDAIAHRLHPGSSGSAITQHLGRLRNTVFVNGHLVPPDLPKSSSSHDPSHHTLRGFYRMEQNVRWSDEDPLFAAKRAITFKDKYEHNALNYGDVHCLPFNPDSALEDGIMVDANNRILRQNNKKVPKSKLKAGTPSRKRLTAKDTSSTTAFSSPRKLASKKKPSVKKPARDPADLLSEDEYNPSAKASASPRRSSRAKRVKTYHEVDPEQEDDEPSEVLEVQEASVEGISNNLQADDDQTNETAPDEVEQAVADRQQEHVASRPHSESSPIHDVLGIYSGIDAQDDQEAQVISSDDDGSSSYDGSSSCEPTTSFGEMLSDDADFQMNEQATLALDLAEAQKVTQDQQVSQMVHMDHDYYGHYAPHVNTQASDAVNAYQQFAHTHNVDGTASSTPSPPAHMHPAPSLVNTPRIEGTLLQTFGAAHMANNMAPMASMGSGFTPPSSMFGGADASGYFGRAIAAAGQSNNQFPGNAFHGGYTYLAGHPNPQGM